MADKRVILREVVDRSAWLGLVVAIADAAWAPEPSDVPWLPLAGGAAAWLVGISMDRLRAYRRQRDALQTRINEALDCIAAHNGLDSHFSANWVDVRKALIGVDAEAVEQ